MKHLFILIAFVFGLQTAFAQQEIIYYYRGNFKPATAETATMRKELKVIDSLHFEMRIFWKTTDDKWGNVTINRVEKLNDSIYKILVYKYAYNKKHKKKRKKKGKEILTKTFTRKYIENEKGTYTLFEYDDEGELRLKGETSQLFPIKKNGKITTYYHGKIYSEAVYDNGIFLSNVEYNFDGSVYARNICPLPDTFIVLKGETLIESMHRQVREYFIYPEEAKDKNQMGKVVATFLIDENLNIVNIYIRESPYKTLSDEVIHIIEQMKFEGKPATVAGKPVKLRYTIPVTFKLVH